MAIYSIDYANKLVKRLQDLYDSILTVERNSMSYSYYVGETPEVPKYSFKDTQEKLDAINRLIINIKHQVREINMTKNIQSGATADKAILELAFLTRKRDKLSRMASNLQRRQNTNSMGSNGSQIIVCNYDVNEAKMEYNKVCNRILTIQDELNTFNALNQIRIEEDIDMFFET